MKKTTKEMLAILVGVALTSSPLAIRNCQADDAALARELETINQSIAKGPFQPAWDSLKNHEDPAWFRDAKFGIYIPIGGR